jgi:hypothetical protein
MASPLPKSIFVHATSSIVAEGINKFFWGGGLEKQAAKDL